jgi:hypothetical protein
VKNLIHDRDAVVADPPASWRPGTIHEKISRAEEMDADTEAKLRSLGYLGSVAPRHGGERQTVGTNAEP